ncbi:MAG: hypothetical protein NTX66_03080 [Candidatus Falkowbacteria bacterium]|nr:hypothetical protein [Candidatus Falkowbacteria bacterium]
MTESDTLIINGTSLPIARLCLTDLRRKLNNNTLFQETTDKNKVYFRCDPSNLLSCQVLDKMFSVNLEQALSRCKNALVPEDMKKGAEQGLDRELALVEKFFGDILHLSIDSGRRI